MTTHAQTEARAIARLEFTCPDCDPDVVEVNLGRYVRFTDHATALAAKDAALAAVKEMYAREGAKAMLESERAERAEAQLGEARKAMGMMLKEHDILSGNFGDVMDPKHKRPDRWPTAAEAARRALGRKA